MQFWPRKRAARPYPRIRSFADGEGLLAFAGYKMGMTHVIAFDTDKNSVTKNEQVSLPVTVLECPPLKVYSVRAYRRATHGLQVMKDIVVAGKDKHLARKTTIVKPSSLPDTFSDGADTITVILMTQPGLTGIGQKKPQLFEVHVGGKTASDQLATAKELIGKEIRASDLFTEGEYVDVRAVTKGKGFQGPVKRFGIGLTSHKSEKSRRTPGSLGGWSGQQGWMYRVAMAGQTGYHQRTQYNNQILKITGNPDEITVAGGFINYGVGRKGNEFVLVKGSVPGPKKRLVTISRAIRLKKTTAHPTIDMISLRSNQGK